MALLPEINIKFRSQAASFVERSERGNVILIVREADAKAATIGTERKYTSAADFAVDENLYSTVNKQAIKDALFYNPFIVYIVAIKTGDPVTAGLEKIPGIVKSGWITVAGISAADSTAIASWIKAQEAKNKSYKAVVYNSAADSAHVVNFANTAVVWADGRTAEASTFTPSLASILAVCNVRRGATNYPCTNLKTVTEPTDVAAEVNAGKLILVNDEDNVVRIAQGVNSLTTLSDGDSEEKKLIENVETIDLMRDDIQSNFRKNYMGAYKNTRDNQMLFVSATNSYFKDLEQMEVLNTTNPSGNVCTIDVDAQRAAWEATGKDTSEWSDDQVKDHPFRRSVFITGTANPLYSIESLNFDIILG